MSRSDLGRLTYRRCFHRGGAALEFALAAPLLLGFVLAAIDLGRFVTTAQRVAAAAAAVADLASQVETFSPEMNITNVVTGRELAVLGLAGAEVARPTDVSVDGAIIVTSATNSGNGAAIAWQRRWGRSDIVSRVSAASVPIGPGEGAVFAEVAANVRPWLLAGRLLGLPETQVFRSVAVRRPRLGGPVIGA
jgi:hypothetical protein